MIPETTARSENSNLLDPNKRMVSEPNAQPHTTMNPMFPRKWKRLASLLGGCLLSGICLCSCATSASPGRAGRKAHQEPGADWVKVQSRPPTWYPRGVPADAPNDHQSGEWVYTENAQGDRYFIPLHGLPTERRARLRNEAMAARSPEKMNRILREDSSHVAKESGTLLFYLSPPGWLVAMGKASSDTKPSGSNGFGGFGGVGAVSPSLGKIGACSSAHAGSCGMGGR